MEEASKLASYDMRICGPGLPAQPSHNAHIGQAWKRLQRHYGTNPEILRLFGTRAKEVIEGYRLHKVCLGQESNRATKYAGSGVVL